MVLPLSFLVSLRPPPSIGAMLGARRARHDAAVVELWPDAHEDAHALA